MKNIPPLFISKFGYYSEGEWHDISSGHILFSIILTAITVTILFLFRVRLKKTNEPQPVLGCLSIILGLVSISFIVGILRAVWESASVFATLTLIILVTLGFAIYKITYKAMNSPKRYAKMFLEDALKKCEMLAYWLSSHNKSIYNSSTKTKQDSLPYLLCFYEYLIYLRQPWLYTDAKDEIEAAFNSHYSKDFKKTIFFYLDTHNVTHTGYMHEVWAMFYCYIVKFGIIPSDVPDDVETFKVEYNDLIEIRSSIEKIFNEKYHRSYNPFKKG